MGEQGERRQLEGLKLRYSEDIDLVWTETRTLSRESIYKLIRYLAESGFDARLATSDAVIVEYSKSYALDLLDDQQDWVVGGVKLTIFSPDEPAVFDAKFCDRLDQLPVATKEEIFNSKALLFAQFCRARDMVDLWWLIEREGIPIERMEHIYRKTGQLGNLKTAITRIRAQSYKDSDPGYSALAKGLPDKDRARVLLIEKLENWLVQKARQAPPVSGFGSD